MASPLICFVHVPKAAGSTVNELLLSALPDGRVHCEALLSGERRLEEVAKHAPWLSGHIDFGTASRRLNQEAIGREVRFFACVREPVAQVRSHYNWLIEIFHRGRDFYQGHPDHVRGISETIRSSGGDVKSIIANLERWAGLFLNLQSRYVAADRVAEYELIVPSSGLDRLLSTMLRRPFVSPGVQANRATYHFDTAVFDTSEMREFLAERNADDEALYQQVRSAE